MPIQPIWPIFAVNRLNWQCCLAGSSKTAPRILIFSIAMGADYSFEVKNIEIWVPAFFKHNNSSVATVSHGSCCKLLLCRMIRLQKGLLTRGVRLENSRGHSPLLHISIIGWLFIWQLKSAYYTLLGSGSE